MSEADRNEPEMTEEAREDKPKSTRGRRAAATKAEDGSATAAPVDESAEEKPRTTRRRRTTAKQVEGDESAAPQEAAEEKPKAARKRRTAAKKAEDAETADETAEDKPKTVRRRRTAAKKAEEEPAAGDAAGAADAAAEEKPKATRRRRAAAKTAEEETAAVAADGAEQEKPKTASRRRSSAKKDEDGAEQLALVGEDAAAEPAPKPRGRRKKAEAEPEAAPEAAADGETAEEKPKTARRRRTVKAAPEAEDAPAEKGTGKDKPTAGKADAPATEATTAEGAPAEGKQQAEGTAAETPATGADAEGKKQSSADKQDGADKRAEGNGKRGNRRRNRRNRHNGQRREIVPSATRDELAGLEDSELIAKARELGLDASEYGERDDLVSAVYDALLQAEGFVMVEGILDLLPDGYGFIRTDGYLPGEHDVYVGMSMVRRNGLRKGDYITGRVRPPRDNEKYPALNTVIELNDEPFEGAVHRVKFANLTPIYPDERLIMEHGKDSITARAIDLVSPIGKGQRGLIVSPPKAGKTTVLKDIAAAISANNPEVHLMCLLVDERPEEVTDMERSIDGEVISSTFDMPSENHIAVAELVIERAKRLVENGQDVVILLDSITRLARAYNLSQPASGRILSGGVDSTALYPPKRFLGAARNIEFGGSLTILGTALIDTGSKMDEVIFEEFKGTGNMELKLDRQLADKRIFPAIDPVSSSTRKDELLIDPQEAPLVWGLRRLLANMNNTERAMKMLIQSLKQTETNQEFLVKSARKAARSAASM